MQAGALQGTPPPGCSPPCIPPSHIGLRDGKKIRQEQGACLPWMESGTISRLRLVPVVDLPPACRARDRGRKGHGLFGGIDAI